MILPPIKCFVLYLWDSHLQFNCVNLLANYSLLSFYSEITCPVGTLSAHLSIDDSYAQSTYYAFDTIKFVCDPGYEMITDSGTRDCGEGGWTGVMPSCKGVDLVV